VKVLFVQEAPCIRMHKMAEVLNDAGIEISLAYNSNNIRNYYKMPMDCYTEHFYLHSYPSFFYIAPYFDIVHCHNEPDIWTGFGIIATKKHTTPVIHDCHDWVSGRQNVNEFVVLAEQMANCFADHALYCSETQRDIINEYTGQQQVESTIIYNAPLEKYIPKELQPKIEKTKNQKKKGCLNIVYAGGLSSQEGHHRNLIKHFEDIMKEGHNLYVYAPRIMDEYSKLRGHREWHSMGHVPYDRLMHEISQYDAGLIPFKPHMFNKDHLNMGLSNKMFEYVSAGLPILCRDNLLEHNKFVKNNNLGFIYSDVKQMKMFDMNMIGEDRHRWTFDKEIKKKLIPLYKRINAKHDYKKVEAEHMIEGEEYTKTTDVFDKYQGKEITKQGMYGMGRDKDLMFESWVYEQFLKDAKND